MLAGLSERGVLALLEGLHREAGSMGGELMLGHLCETARTTLTEWNFPEGNCAICLEPLRESPTESPGQPVQKLPCFHCLHRYSVKAKAGLKA